MYINIATQFFFAHHLVRKIWIIKQQRQVVFTCRIEFLYEIKPLRHLPVTLRTFWPQRAGDRTDSVGFYQLVFTGLIVPGPKLQLILRFESPKINVFWRIGYVLFSELPAQCI